MKVFDAKTKNTLESVNPIVVKAWMSDAKRYKEVGVTAKSVDAPDTSMDKKK